MLLKIIICILRYHIRIHENNKHLFCNIIKTFYAQNIVKIFLIFFNFYFNIRIPIIFSNEIQ
jgi:hypothetical protein